MNDEPKPGAGTGAGNGNSVAKPTSYENLSTLDGHFNGIIEKLSATASHKATPAELKTELEGHVATAKLLRSRVIGLIVTRLADHETKLAAKLAGK